jgi:hypothetical protein
VTSDFYNFDTESSGICEGITTCYNLQLSYKVQVDEYLIQFFERNSINLDFFVAAGLNIRAIGKCKISLKELIDRNTEVEDHISAVVKSQKVIVGVNKDAVIGEIKYTIRMRNPISKFLKWKAEQEILGFDKNIVK